MSYRVKRIRIEVEGKNGWSRWIEPIQRRYILSCCDCGLAHYFNFRVRDGRVSYQAKRAPGYTARERRQKDHVCKPVLTIKSKQKPKQRRARRRRVLSKRPRSE